jgi:hypothetical protein
LYGGADLTLNEFIREYHLAASNTDLYHNRDNYDIFLGMELDYYDGDLTDPGVTGQFAAQFGNQVDNLDILQIDGTIFARARIVPWQPRPLSAANIYRPAFTLLDLISDFDGSVVHAGATYPEQYFYGVPLENTNSATNAVLENNGVQKSYHTRNYIDLSLYSAGFEYVFYGGTFPANQSDTLSFSLTNGGGSNGKMREVKLVNADPQITLTGGALALASPEVDVGAQISYAVSLSANPAGATGIFTAELHYTYDNHVQVDGENLPNELVTKKILIMFEALPTASTPNIEFSVRDFDLTIATGIPPVEAIQAPVAINSKLNHQSGADIVTWSWVKNDTPDIDSGYAKKRLIIENTSSSPLYNLKYLYKDAPSSTTLSTIEPLPSYTIDKTNCAAALAATRPVVSLAPFSSCYLDITYQPQSGDAPRNTFFTVNYETAQDQFVFKQFQITLDPKEPAFVQAVGKTSKPIPIPAGVTPSYALNFSAVNFDNDPTVVSFEENGGLFAAIELQNLVVEARASFLKTYHKYLVQYAIDPAPALDQLPAPGDYRSVNGRNVAIIHKTTYGPGTAGADRVVVEATEGCLIGEDPPGASFEKGFNASSPAQTCMMHITLNMNFNYIAEALTSTDPNDTFDNHIELEYYNNLRASTSFIYFHFEGIIHPNASTWSGDYFNVEADSGRNVDFEWDTFAPNNPALGPIVGYKVFKGTSATAVSNNIFNGGDSENVFDETVTAFSQSVGLNNGEYYYYRVYPVRYNANFTDTTKFPGLAAGEWISPSDATVLKLVVPPIGMYYDHENFALIELDKESNSPTDIVDARAACLGKAILPLMNAGAIVSKPYKLINQDIWDSIDSDPSNSSDVSYNSKPHWIDGAVYNIATVFAANSPVPGANEVSREYPGDKMYFLRKSDKLADPVYRLGGGLFSPAKADYDMYVHGEVPFGLARCWIDIR